MSRKRRVRRTDPSETRPDPARTRHARMQRRARAEFRAASARFQSGRVDAFNAVEVVDEDVIGPLAIPTRIRRGSRPHGT
jgi:hypothetical protein